MHRLPQGSSLAYFSCPYCTARKMLRTCFYFPYSGGHCSSADQVVFIKGALCGGHLCLGPQWTPRHEICTYTMSFTNACPLHCPRCLPPWFVTILSCQINTRKGTDMEGWRMDCLVDVFRAPKFYGRLNSFGRLCQTCGCHWSVQVYE